jgi:hypothetical protein
MDSDALTTGFYAGVGSLDNVWFITAPGITQSSNLVYVDTEIDHVPDPPLKVNVNYIVNLPFS